MVRGARRPRRNEPGTDLWAIEHGFVSITPLRLDLTDHAALADVAARHPEPPSDAAPGGARSMAP